MPSNNFVGGFSHVTVDSTPLPTGGSTSENQVVEQGILTDIKTNTVSNNGIVSSANSTSTPLNAGLTWTGSAEDVSKYPSVVVSCKTDQDGSLTIQFSTDGTNWDSVLTYTVTANLNEVHRISVSKKYVRATFTNTSAVNQTFLRLQVIYGSQQTLNSALNGVIQADADAIVTRPSDFNLNVASNLYQSHKTVFKDGLNLNLGTSASVTISAPQDVFGVNTGGIYPGFYTGSVEEGQIVVAGADTGTVSYSYLETPTSTAYVFATKAITGAGNYDLGHTIWRCNYMVFNSGTVANVNTISLRHKITTANVFCVIATGYGQTFNAAYTVPFGSTAYVDRITGTIKGSATGSADAFLYYRPYGQSPYLRQAITLNFGSLYFDDIDYLFAIPARTDFIPRVITSSTNSQGVQLSYRILEYKQ